MKVYTDKRGWKFKVMPGLGVSTYKARYSKPEWKGAKWRCLTVLPWRDNTADAEADLAEYAKKHEMEASEE